MSSKTTGDWAEGADHDDPGALRGGERVAQAPNQGGGANFT